MSTKKYDIAIIGGGILGMATAMSVTSRFKSSVLVIEAENRLASHQTGNNSGVIHSGLYYKPGSLKAQNCVQGRDLMYRFCEENNIPHEKCGKIVIATCEKEIPLLEELQKKGEANGLEGLKKLKAEEIREHEPHATGIQGLLVPQTGIVDYIKVTETFAEKVKETGGEIKTNTRFCDFKIVGDEIILGTTSGEFQCSYLINCGGLYCDRIARICGVDPKLRIIPFRGEYYKLVPKRRSLVRNLIYPVPDPEFPFLGVHFTRMIDGGVEAGPNAVLALKREGYKKFSLSSKDIMDMFSYRGFWFMAGKYWKMGFGELYRSLSKKVFVKSLQKLVSDLGYDDIKPGGAGVRAQAVEPDGRLVDDFRFAYGERSIHVLNAPSPAATASINIGKTIAEMAMKYTNKSPF